MALPRFPQSAFRDDNDGVSRFAVFVLPLQASAGRESHHESLLELEQ
jgi:hypothetical protein